MSKLPTQAWNKAKISPHIPLKTALSERENHSTNDAFWLVESRDAHRLRSDWRVHHPPLHWPKGKQALRYAADRISTLKLRFLMYSVREKTILQIQVETRQELAIFWYNPSCFCILVFLIHNFHEKRKEVCIKPMSTSASCSLKG